MSARIFFLLVGVFTFAAAVPGHAGDMYVFVDDDGVVHVGDQPRDPRAERWTPGLFEAWAMGQKRAPHRGQRRVVSGTPKSDRFRVLIDEMAKKHGVRVALLRAVVAVESAFNPDAVSRVGASGLMQLMPATAKDLGVKDIFDPRQNVDGGARYLANLIRMFDGDERLALAGYNAGPGRVRRLGRIPDFPETQAYVVHVLELANAETDVVRGR